MYSVYNYIKDQWSVKNRLRHVSIDDTCIFHHNLSECKVVGVENDNTIIIATIHDSCPSKIYRYTVLLDGMYTRNHDYCTTHCTVTTQNTLSNAILNKIVRLKHVEYLPNGNLIAKVYYNNIDVSTMMMKHYMV